MTLKERLLSYLEFKEIKKSHFEKNIGVSNGYINSLKKSPSAARLNEIKNRYKDINIEWLLTGEGEMIKMEGKDPTVNVQLDKDQKSIPSDLKDKNRQMYVVADDKSIYPVQDGITQIDDSAHMEVEFRDLSVSAGPLSRTYEQASKKTLLVPKEYDRGEYLVVRVDGNSMQDGTEYSIPAGANILIKRIYPEKGESLPIRGNLFVIDAKDGQALKQIIEHNVDEGYIVCHSYNPEYSDYKVRVEDILGFYIYRKIVGYRPPVRDLN